MTPNRLIQVVCVFVTVVCLLGAATLAPIIDKQRVDLQLNFTVTEEMGRDMPPEVALAVTCLGAFRGLIVNFLWARTETLKQAGKYYEANTLAETITTLQPRFGQVWLFQSWNMAYNISVGTQTPQERWEWVSKGIELLRDRGIPYNETNIALYQQLSWTFFHKIGKHTDDAHWYYKSRLAEEWGVLLGRGGEGAAPQQVIEYFRQIADAPSSLEELIGQQPELTKLIDKLTSMNLKPDDELVRQVGLIELYYLVDELAYADPTRRDQLLGDLSIDPRLIELMKNQVDVKRLASLMSTLRRRRIVRHYHMDPTYMIKMMDGKAPGHHFEMDQQGDVVDLRELGVELKQVPAPYDWRHPAAHAAYWALLGTDKAVYRFNKKNVDQLNTYRNFIHSVQEMMYAGRVEYNPYLDVVEARVQMLPNIAFFDVYDQAYEAGLAFLKTQKFESQGAEDSFDMGHMNFLEKGVVFSYLYGDEEKAGYYYEKVRRLYSDRPDNRGGRYNAPMAEFVSKEIAQTFSEVVGRIQLVDAMLGHAFNRGLAEGQYDAYHKFRDRAASVFKKVSDQTIKPTVSERERLGFVIGSDGKVGSFQEVEAFMLSNYLKNRATYLGKRSRAFRNAPTDLQQRVYDLVASPIRAECGQLGVDVAAMLPEPSGMDAYRKAHPLQPFSPDADSPAQRERK